MDHEIAIFKVLDFQPYGYPTQYDFLLRLRIIHKFDDLENHLCILICIISILSDKLVAVKPSMISLCSMKLSLCVKNQAGKMNLDDLLE